MVGMITPIQLGVSFAQPAPAAAASSSASTQMADKDSAMKSLADAKKKFRTMRKHSSQDPHAQADLDSQIKQINGLMAKLKKGESVSQSDVDAAVATPAGMH
jgi:parvulin-like peptidyl-prolyl isomerase